MLRPPRKEAEKLLRCVGPGCSGAKAWGVGGGAGRPREAPPPREWKGGPMVEVRRTGKAGGGGRQRWFEDARGRRSGRGQAVATSVRARCNGSEGNTCHQHGRLSSTKGEEGGRRERAAAGANVARGSTSSISACFSEQSALVGPTVFLCFRSLVSSPTVVVFQTFNLQSAWKLPMYLFAAICQRLCWYSTR